MKKLVDLINSAQQNVEKIVEATKNCPNGHFTAFYAVDGYGYKCGYIQKGWETKERCIGFGSRPMDEIQVKEIINQERNMLP